MRHGNFRGWEWMQSKSRYIGSRSERSTDKTYIPNRTVRLGWGGASRVLYCTVRNEGKTSYLQVPVNNASVVAVLDSLQQRADEIPGLLLVVHHLLHDAVEQLPPCIRSWTGVDKMDSTACLARHKNVPDKDTQRRTRRSTAEAVAQRTPQREEVWEFYSFEIGG